MLAKWIVAFLAVVSVGSEVGYASKVGGRTVEGNGKQRDLFDQMIHSLAGKYMPGLNGGETTGWQWTVHPLPRKRQLSLSPSLFGGNGGDGEDTGSGNALPASILAAVASPSAAASSGGSASASVTGSSDRSTSASPSATNSPTSSVVASTATTPTSSAIPLSRLITSNIPASSTVSTNTETSTSSSSTTATPTNKDNVTSASLMSPKNKLFPLVVAGLAAAGLVALMLLIAIARCVAHDQLRRDNLRKTYSFDGNCEPKKPDRFTTAPALGAARSVRRALTKKKLGSFARRTQDGSVLIEVGDEVFAVPPHLADSYRERILSEKRSRSDLTSVSDESMGLFGVKPKYLNDGGPDGDEQEARAKYDRMLEEGVENGGVKRGLSQRLGDRLRSLRRAATAQVEEASGGVMERDAYSFATGDQQRGAVRQTDLASRNPVVTSGSTGWHISQRQSSAGIAGIGMANGAAEESAFGTVQVYSRGPAPPRPPVLTRAPPKTTSTSALKNPARRGAPKLELSVLTEKLADLEKQTLASSRLPAEASLTHSSGASAGTAGTFGSTASSTTSGHASESLPGAFPQRTKSLHRAKSVKPPILDSRLGSYRHRSPDAHPRSKSTHNRAQRHTNSVPLASPTRFTHEKQPRLVVHPQKPQPAQSPSSSSSSFRPLPVPPPFTLPK